MIKKPNWLFYVVAIVLLLSGGWFFLFQRPIDSAKHPNIIFILTDDLDLKLMPYMESVNSLIASQGAVFTNYFVTASTCCPSRASILRGQYPHNTGVFENSPGFATFYEKKDEKQTIATWLEKSGYRTSYLGKYLNLYPAGAERTYVPPGWDDWHVFLYGPSENFYYAYTMNENGKLVKYGKHEDEYSTDVIRHQALDFIDASVQKKSPFFLVVAAYAPHGPTRPALRHSQLYEEIEYPKGESFQEADISDKPAIIRELSQTSGVFEIQDADRLFRRRVQTMQSVDEMVAALVQKLEQSGELDNTYIIFTSDNGFHMGEHTLSSGKMLPYEEDIHVPLIIRGPGIQPGTTIEQITANIDIAPTLAELANARTANFIDGRSLVPFLHSAQSGQISDTTWRESLLLEAGNLDRESPVIAYRGIRTEKFVYVEYENGELEYYDLAKDPYELQNLAGTLSDETLSTLHSWLEQLKSCQADECRKAEMIPFDGLQSLP